MPKIRGVKPDYWTDEDIVELSIPARLLFIGLWNYACDNGHLADKPKQIKMRILPGDEVNVAELLRELEDKTRIERHDGWIVIPNLTTHQKPDRRYFATCDREGCEAPQETVSQREARRVHAVQTPGTPRAHDVRTPGAHVDGDGDGDGDVMVKGSDRPGKPAAARGRALPEDFRPSDAHQTLATELGIDLRAEWPQFVDHHRSKGSTMKDWDAALRTWIRNAKKFGRGPAATQATAPDWNARVLPTPPPDIADDPERYATWLAEQRRAG